MTRVNSRLTLSLRYSMEATEVAHTFSFKCSTEKKSQRVKSDERGGTLLTLPSNPISGALIDQIRSHSR